MIILKYDKEELITKIEHTLQVLKVRNETALTENYNLEARTRTQCEDLLNSWVQDVEQICKEVSWWTKKPKLFFPRLAERLSTEEFIASTIPSPMPDRNPLYFNGSSLLSEKAKLLINTSTGVFVYIYHTKRSFSDEIEILKISLSRLKDNSVLPQVEIDSNNRVLQIIELAQSLESV